MFGPESTPHVFGIPCGLDYTRAVKNGLLHRLSAYPPEMLARTEIYVNTGRMKRDLTAAFSDGAAHFVPRIRLITNLSRDPQFSDLPLPVSGFRLRLELAQLIARFLERKPEFAEPSSIFDLADGLALLMGEMHDEDVTLDTLKSIEVKDVSGHWIDALSFISLVKEYYENSDDAPLLNEERLRCVVERLADQWGQSTPDYPILVVGSTGSRGTTAAFMDVVARLPMGAVVLPGVDFDLPADIWQRIDADTLRDHPQERVVRIASRLGLAQRDVTPFSSEHVETPERNRLLSLALRPAPVTDQWMRDGPLFEGVERACSNVTLIEAPDPRREANAVALVLRKAAEDGKRAALVTPDRTLARQVSAALDRWSIEPEDAAGVPLNQTPSGRLFRHVVSMFGKPVTAQDLLIVLKHPLVAAGLSAAPDSSDLSRGFHLLWLRQLEVQFRQYGPALPTGADIAAWAQSKRASGLDVQARMVWAVWIGAVIEALPQIATQHISAHLNQALTLTQHLVKGPNGTDAEPLWTGLDGREMRRVMDEFQREAHWGGALTTIEFDTLFRSVIGRAMSRDPSPKHPDIMIWGTLDARTLRADLVVLGGLNDGIWPPQPSPDPWFSRDMRKAAGLLSPEQHIGLSAHDFQQGFGAREVVLSRSLRDAEAETVASRWVIRLSNLLKGMSAAGQQAHDEMLGRGNMWIDWANQLDLPSETAMVQQAKRPSPRPPVAARPRSLSVTAIETLIRDPYEIYARKILDLQPLPHLTRHVNMRDRGIAFHSIMERFVLEIHEGETVSEASARLIATADSVLEATVQSASFRRVWLARIRRIADRLAQHELERAQKALRHHVEVNGRFTLQGTDFTLTCKADRIDDMRAGGHHIYDYKSGEPPTEKQANTFQIQLLLEAMMFEDGEFDGLSSGRVLGVSYLGLSDALKQVSPQVDGEVIAQVRTRFANLIAQYDKPEQGYTARRAPAFIKYESDFALLSRFSEWGDSDDAFPEDVA